MESALEEGASERGGGSGEERREDRELEEEGCVLFLFLSLARCPVHISASASAILGAGRSEDRPAAMQHVITDQN